MAVMDIVAGILIGAVVGIINALVLRYGVRFALTCTQRAKATLVIVGSYAIRYALIAVVIYAILKKGNMTIAMTTLGVLVLMTILLALFQRGQSPVEKRGP